MSGPTGADPLAGDVIEIRGLRVRGHHGVLEHEQRLGQVFVVDATLAVDLRPAGDSDALRDTVHYGHVAEELVAAVAETRFALLEALAAHLADIALARDGVRAVQIRVAKPAAPIAADLTEVAVSVRRP